jgi:hypothetical protein
LNQTVLLSSTPFQSSSGQWGEREHG